MKAHCLFQAVVCLLSFFLDLSAAGNFQTFEGGSKSFCFWSKSISKGRTHFTFLHQTGEVNKTSLVLFDSVWSRENSLLDCITSNDQSVTESYVSKCWEAGSRTISETPDGRFNISELVEPAGPCMAVGRLAGLRGRSGRRSRDLESIDHKTASMRQTNGETGLKLRRSKRAWLIPGTLWCGAGNKALDFADLGVFEETDKCCREHDHCKDAIDSFGFNYGIFNTNIFTLSHCDCDTKFRRCLHKANDSMSNVVGYGYFNVLKMRCFEFSHRMQCAERTWWGMCKFHQLTKYALVKDATYYNSTSPELEDEIRGAFHQISAGNHTFTTGYAMSSTTLTEDPRTTRGEHDTASGAQTAYSTINSPKLHEETIDTPDLETTDSPQTKRTELSQTKTIDSTETNTTDSTQTKTTDLTQTKTTDLTQTKTTDSAQTKTTDSAQTKTTDLTQIKTTDSAETNTTDSAQTKTTDSTQTKTTDSTQTKTTDLTQTKTTDSAQTKTTDSAQTKTTDSAQTKTTDLTQIKTTDSAETNTTDLTETNTTDLTQIKTTDLTQIKTTDSAQIKTTDLTQTKYTDPTQIKTTDLTQRPKTNSPLLPRPPPTITGHSHQAPATGSSNTHLRPEIHTRQKGKLETCASYKDLDSCRHQIPGMQEKYGLRNSEFTTLYHCNCTARLATEFTGQDQADDVHLLLLDFVSQFCFLLPQNCTQESCFVSSTEAPVLRRWNKGATEGRPLVSSKRKIKRFNSRRSKRKDSSFRLFKKCLRMHSKLHKHKEVKNNIQDHGFVAPQRQTLK